MTQANALEILKTGANVFLTGEPGSGKTHLINCYIRYLKEHGVEPAVTASTGIAATHVGGQTIHSWSGIGIKHILSEADVDALSTKEYLVKRLLHTSVLIIDEISMLDADTFSAVDAVCRSLRRLPEKPFGGLQVIAVGDFFQLPPITRRDEESARFVFESPSWKDAEFLVTYLHEQHRHTDALHSAILSSIRRGEGGDEDSFAQLSALCEECANTVQVGDEDVPELYTHNADVDRINDERLAKLPGKSHFYKMYTHGKTALVEQLQRGCLSPEILELKVGAAVMFTKNNFEAGYANGTLGTVERFEENNAPVVKLHSGLSADETGKKVAVEAAEWMIEENGKVLARVGQLPLRLAWAITIHKSQGMSLDAAIMDLSKTFEYGQGYVALSRVRTLKGITLRGINGNALRVHPQILVWDEHFKELSAHAEEAFARLSPSELALMQVNFLSAVGGKSAKVSSSSSATKKYRGRPRGKAV